MHSPAGASSIRKNRFEALDGWRGICACLVVLFHFHGYSPIYSWPLIRNSYLFVDFFFVLSGFVIALNYGTRMGSFAAVRRFLILRIGRVYPLHVFMLLCFIAYESLRYLQSRAQASPAPTFTGPTDPLAILSNLLLVQSLNVHDSLTWNGPSWSISTELWAYIVFAFVSMWLGMRNWLLVLTALIAPWLLMRLSSTGMDTTFDWGLLRCILGFALGVACHRMHNRWPSALALGPVTSTLLECLAVAAVIVFVSCAGTGALSFAAPFVFAAVVLVFASEEGMLSRTLRMPVARWLGTISYSIYLTHFIFVTLLPSVIKRVTHLDLWTAMPLANGQYVLAYGRNNVEGTLLYGAVLLVTLAFSAFTYRWIETPGRDWTRRWLGRPVSSPAAVPQPNGGPASSP